jgi:hypothetical protein
MTMAAEMADKATNFGIAFDAENPASERRFMMRFLSLRFLFVDDGC